MLSLHLRFHRLAAIVAPFPIIQRFIATPFDSLSIRFNAPHLRANLPQNRPFCLEVVGPFSSDFSPAFRSRCDFLDSSLKPSSSRAFERLLQFEVERKVAGNSLDFAASSRLIRWNTLGTVIPWHGKINEMELLERWVGWNDDSCFVMQCLSIPLQLTSTTGNSFWDGIAPVRFQRE